MPTSCIWGDVVRCVLGHPRIYKWAWHRALEAFSEDVAACQQDRLQACEWRHVHWHSGRFETGTDGILRSGQTPREDYLELLWLCYVFLGGSFDGDVGFHAPGAIHNARWIAKALYSVKIFLFKDQVKLTARETAGLTSISLFVSLVYTRYWHEAPIAERVPFNDFKMLALLHQYPEHRVRDAAVKAFNRHLWYFSQHLVPLVLFDDRVTEETKAAMVENFARLSKPVALRRLDIKSFDHRAKLETYVISRSLNIFNLLSTNGKEEAKVFLSKSPAIWPSDPTHQQT